MSFETFEFYAIVIHYVADRNHVEILTQNGGKYVCVVQGQAKRRLCLGAIGTFSGTIGNGSILFLTQTFIETYPSLTNVWEASALGFFLFNCRKLTRFGLIDKGVFCATQFFVLGFVCLKSEECKKLLFCISMIKLLSLAGFLSERDLDSVNCFLKLFDTDFETFKANLSIGFTTEAFDARIMFVEILSSTSKQFDLNLKII